MRRLVIDDLRVMVFDAVYARTSAAAIDLLGRDGTFDEVWFDHDLGGDDTTRPVALWLLERAFYGRAVPIGRCIVHTDNAPGRDHLRAQLGSHYETLSVDAAVYLDHCLPSPTSGAAADRSSRPRHV